MEILVVDLETTGFDSKTDLIVEIGIALVDTDTKEIKMVFDKPIKETGFDYETHKNSWIFENTTLTPEDIMSAKSIEEYFDEIQGLFDKYKMTAFNKTFDIRFLTRCGFKMDDVDCIMRSATKYSRYVKPDGKKKIPSVEEIYRQFFLTEEYIEEHRAGQDALDEAKILLKLVELKNDPTYEIPSPIIVEQKKKYTVTFPFGKYKGKKVSDVIETDKQYILWATKNFPKFDLSPEIVELLMN
jgi:DNA polymerase III epsilon subunit-like protein